MKVVIWRRYEVMFCDLCDTQVDVVRASTAVGSASRDGRVIVDNVAETPCFIDQHRSEKAGYVVTDPLNGEARNTMNLELSGGYIPLTDPS